MRQPAPQRGRGSTSSEPLSLPLRLSEQQVTIPGDPAKIECLPAGLSPLWLLGIFWRGRRGKREEHTPRTYSWLLKLSSELSCPSTPLSPFSIPSSSEGLCLPGAQRALEQLSTLQVLRPQSKAQSMTEAELVWAVGHGFSLGKGRPGQGVWCSRKVLRVVVMLSGPNRFLWVGTSALLFVKPETCAGAAPF